MYLIYEDEQGHIKETVKGSEQILRNLLETMREYKVHYKHKGKYWLTDKEYFWEEVKI